MKAENRYTENPVQDLLNAVVMQAAEDYREYSARLLKNPKDWAAAKEKEAIRRFFFSPEFGYYTTVEGKMVLNRLDQEIAAAEKAVQACQQIEVLIRQEARLLAKRILQQQSDGEDKRVEIADRKEKINDLISALQSQQMQVAKYMQNQLNKMTCASVKAKATRELKEDILNGKEDLWN